MEYLQFYQDMSTGTVMALLMNKDGTPHQESTPEIHKGKPCYTFYEVVQKMSLTIVKLKGPKPPDPEEYRPIDKQEALSIDQMTEYSMYGIFAASGGVSYSGRFFGEMGKEGKDWQEMPHPHLQPTLTFHADVQDIYCDQDFFHTQCAAEVFGIDTINKVINLQRKHSLHTIVESSQLYEQSPKLGDALIEVRWKGSTKDEEEYCSKCQKRLRDDDNS